MVEARPAVEQRGGRASRSPNQAASIPALARRQKLEPTRLSMDMLDDLEEEIELLKVAYERYFNGVDRVPPAREHDRVKLHLRNLQRMRGGSTVIRFRLQQLRARIVTYEHYWTRILRQIERGTFKRVVAESKRREFEALRRKAEEGGAQASQSGILAKVEREAGQSGVRPMVGEPRTPPKPGGRATLPQGFNAKEARSLFKQFVAAKKAAGEPVSGLTYGRLVDKLAREVPKLQEKHGDGFRFEVATVNGKVRLRARKRRSESKSDKKAS